jgi:hypothetical protein
VVAITAFLPIVDRVRDRVFLADVSSLVPPGRGVGCAVVVAFPPRALPGREVSGLVITATCVTVGRVTTVV